MADGVGETSKRCPICHRTKAAHLYHKSSTSSDGLQSQCKACRRKLAPPKNRANELRRRYKMTVDQYDALATSQNGACAICGRNNGKKRLCVDHDHACCPTVPACGECNRGLLCNECNHKLLGRICQEGKLGRDHAISVLRRAVEYLERYAN